MEYDCATRTVAGTTLVTVRVRNEAAVPRRVRVRNDLPGPVLPPRRDGVPERGWDDDGFTGVVAAGDERALGYACPVDCGDETPVSVDCLGRPDDADDSDAELEAEAIRSLGRARPPADAVPTPAVAESARSVDDAADAADTAGAGGAGNEDSVGAGVADDADGAVDTDDTAGADDAPDADDATDPAPVSPDAYDGGDPPRSVESWLSAVETRVGRAESLTDATAAEAAAVLEATGSVAGLPAAVEADEASLRAFAARAAELAERAADADAEPVVAAVEEL